MYRMFGLSLVMCLISTFANAETVAQPTISAINPTTQFGDIYYTQPHNTYDTNSSLPEWLNAGIRAFELDVINKNWSDSPEKGPIVAHAFQLDGKRLGEYLTEITTWLDNNDTDVPVVVYIDLKGFGGGTWSADKILALDSFITQALGSYQYSFLNLMSYYGVNDGTQANPRALVAKNGWPNLYQLKQKIIVVFTGGELGQVNSNMSEAILLGGTQAFLCPNVEFNDDLDSLNELNAYGEIEGFTKGTSRHTLCVNTPVDDSYQLLSNKAAEKNLMQHVYNLKAFSLSEYAYNYVAVSHGAQMINRDFNSVNDDLDFGGAIPMVGLRESLPGYFQIKSMDSTDLCLTVDGDVDKRTDVVQEKCSSDNSKQMFTYTAEGQLRPKGDYKYCIDIDGGSAENNSGLHLWDCDGGDSEKWNITKNGEFISLENDTYCVDSQLDTDSGIQWQTYQCQNKAQQKFYLAAVPNWLPTNL